MSNWKFQSRLPRRFAIPRQIAVRICPLNGAPFAGLLCLVLAAYSGCGREPASIASNLGNDAQVTSRGPRQVSTKIDGDCRMDGIQYREVRDGRIETKNKVHIEVFIDPTYFIRGNLETIGKRMEEQFPDQQLLEIWINTHWDDVAYPVVDGCPISKTFKGMGTQKDGTAFYVHNQRTKSSKLWIFSKKYSGGVLKIEIPK